MCIPAFILFLQDQKTTDFLLNLTKLRYCGLSAGCPAQLKARAVILVVGGPVFPVRIADNSKALFNCTPLTLLSVSIIVLSTDIVKKL